MRKIIDLSLIVEEGILMPFLKERDEGFVLDVVKTHDSGPAHGTVVEMYLHVGTHVDAPLHFVRGGDTIDQIPLDRLVGDALALDPMGLIASGSLPAAVSPADAPALIEALAQEGIPAREIGRFTDRADGLKAVTDTGIIDLPQFPRDELARHFST